MDRKEYMRNYLNERNKLRREHGLCVQCGAVAEIGTLCFECKHKARINTRNYLQRRTILRDAENLCVKCGAELDTNTRYCKKCTEYFHKQYLKRKAKYKK